MKFETKIEKKEKGIIAVIVKMPFSEIEKKREEVIKKLSENADIEGFRKGRAPIDVIEKKIGEAKILQETSQEVINDVFPEILKKEKLQIIGYPSISVTKLAAGNDFEFTVEMTVYPEVELPDYKKIAKGIKKEESSVTDEDVRKVEENLLAMQNQMAHQGHEHKEGEDTKCDHQDSKELTDDFVKQLGPFENVADFREKLKKDLKVEKDAQAVSKHREEIAEGILTEVKMDVPEILLNAELDKIMATLKDDIQKRGNDFKKYLEDQNKKDEMELRDSYIVEAEKRSKIEVVLKEISQKENIEADKEKMDEQVVNIVKAHGEENLENIRLYVQNIMINEEVMKFLEKQ
jgi:trigger factor